MPVHYESRISTQVNEDEVIWQGFLADEDAYQVVSQFKRAKKATARGDANIVLEAEEERRTIITSNGRHFVGYIKEHQRRDNKVRCRDLFGLLIIPNHQLIRERALKTIMGGYTVGQIGRLRWRAIGFLNLCIHLTDSGQVKVSRFERCMYCEKESALGIKEPWADWYAGLPVV